MEEIEEIQCPICNMSFRDKRGLTSHARNKHDLERSKILELLSAKKSEGNKWNFFIGIGFLILSVVTAGKVK